MPEYNTNTSVSLSVYEEWNRLFLLIRIGSIEPLSATTYHLLRRDHNVSRATAPRWVLESNSELQDSGAFGRIGIRKIGYRGCISLVRKLATIRIPSAPDVFLIRRRIIN